MAHILKDLEVNEISLVDSPSNRGARIALYKRDHSSALPREQRIRRLQDRCLANGEKIAAMRKEFDAERALSAAVIKSLADRREQLHERIRKEKSKMEFQQILKSASTRGEIARLVRHEAIEIAVKKHCTLEQAEDEVWKTSGAQELYESTPPDKPKRAEPRMMAATRAEAELDRRARKVMKRDGIGYPQAASRALTEDPSLYTQYLDEQAAGATYEVPEPAELHEVEKAMAAAPDAADGECPSCGAGVDPDDNYCAECGEELVKTTTPKPKAKPRG